MPTRSHSRRPATTMMVMMMMHQGSFSKSQAPHSSPGVLAAMPADCFALYPYSLCQ